jgi:parvulin-like peptidyl-prolyl isomerase
VQKLREAADKEFETQWIKPILRGNPQFKSEAEFKAALRSENISLDMMKRQWTRHFMADQFMRQMVQTAVDKIGHPQILDYYTKHPEEFQVPDSVQWEDIFVAEALHPPRAAARDRAEAILARLRQGEKVEQLLKEKLNDGDSGSRGGAGKGSKHGEIQPTVVEATLFQLKDGEAALVEIESGYHVIRVVKREYAGMIDFSDPKMQKRIKDKLRNEIGQDAMKKLAKKLRSEAVVEYTKTAN